MEKRPNPLAGQFISQAEAGQCEGRAQRRSPGPSNGLIEVCGNSPRTASSLRYLRCWSGQNCNIVTNNPMRARSPSPTPRKGHEYYRNN